ncbi:MAG: PilN domain-containing protein [Candidatus Omnitrophica bacterium]|nr:PilN domain-containing protein [Candidatus Omnitrophota bacterium]
MSEVFLGLGLTQQEIIYVYLEKINKKTFVFTTGGRLYIQSTSFSPTVLHSYIEQILTKEKASPKKIFISIFRSDIVTHQLVFPKMSCQEMEEVVPGEIEKIPNFSNKEFEYLYFPYEPTDKKIKVIFVAILKELLNHIVEGIRPFLSSISVESIEISPLNFLNVLYRLDNFSEGILIAVDDRCSYILIFLNNECKIFYVSNIGKSELCLSKDGERKINSIVFSNWQEELRRLFRAYSVEYKRDIPHNIWLVWDDKEGIPFDKLLSEGLGSRVNRLDIERLSNIKVEDKELLNPIYGIAASSLISYIKNYKSEFSFEKLVLPVKFKRELNKLIFLSISYLIIVGLFLGGIIFINSFREKILTKKLKEIKSEVVLLESKANQLNEEMNELLAIKERLLNQARVIREINRISWSRVFGDIVENLPQQVSLNSFKVAKSGRVEIRGETLQIESVAQLMRNLENSKVLAELKFDFMRSKEKEGRRTFSFGIVARLKERE